MCIAHQHHTCRPLACLKTPGMVTVTIHVQPYSICSGCLFDEQLYKSWTFLQITSKTLRQIRCSHHHATILSRLQCVQLWRCRQHLFQPFLDSWNRHSVRTFQIQRLDNQLSVSRVWFILKSTPFYHRSLNARTDSRFAPAVHGSLQPPDNVRWFVCFRERFDVQLSQHFTDVLFSRQ